MQWLLQRLVGLSPLAEFVIVVLLAFGWALDASTREVLWPRPFVLENEHLWQSIGIELPIIFALGALLWLRGWRPSAIGLTPSWRDSAVGAGLAVIALLIRSSSGSRSWLYPQIWPNG